MKAKVKAAGEIVEVKEWRGTSDVVYSTTDMNMFYAENELEIIPDTREKVIDGWVSRDFDGLIYLHKERPQLHEESGSWFSKQSIRLDNSCFPFITWDSSPKRVKITITPMEG